MITKDDPVTDSLFLESDDHDFDTLTEMAVECMSAEMLVLLERQAEDQLEGGKYANPTPEQ